MLTNNDVKLNCTIFQNFIPVFLCVLCADIPVFEPIPLNELERYVETNFYEGDGNEYEVSILFFSLKFLTPSLAASFLFMFSLPFPSTDDVYRFSPAS